MTFASILEFVARVSIVVLNQFGSRAEKAKRISLLCIHNRNSFCVGGVQDSYDQPPLGRDGKGEGGGEVGQTTRAQINQ